ncbi:hypothetical protein ACROYT_G042656 [Oculina patagonica]
MKRKVDWDDEEEESGKEDNISSDAESDSEEPRIKDVLNNLSKAVSRKYASELLHMEGLAELGVNTRLIKNKKILSDILQKEQAYRDKEEEVDDGNSTDSNEEEETASEEGIGAEESQESDSDSDEETENSDSDSSALIHAKAHNPCQHCEGPNVYDTAVMKCPMCFWEDNCKICPICEHEIPLDRKHGKHSLRRCYDCGAIIHKNEETSKITYYPPRNDEDEDDS